jgi:hypothetical protein
MFSHNTLCHQQRVAVQQILKAQLIFGHDPQPASFTSQPQNAFP